MERDHKKCVRCGKAQGDKTTVHDHPHIVVWCLQDHIMPIALGGEEFDMDNLQTLCSDCNRAKTRLDMHNISRLRRKIKTENTANDLKEAHRVIKDFL